MLSPPQILTTEGHEAAVIHLTIPRAEMMSAFGPAVDELMGILAEQKIEPIGAVFAHHFRITPDTFDFELGVRVGKPVAPAGRVKPGELPGRKVARAVYTGPYEGLPAAWGAFDAWMRAKGCRQGDDLWEVYAVGPESTPDPAGWQTELNRPLLA